MTDATPTQRILLDCFSRVSDVVRDTLDGIDERHLTERVGPTANSIAWLIWHLTRVQDDHIATVADREQVWISRGWRERFALPFPPDALGYGHSSDDVRAVRSSAADLLGYFEEVHRATTTFVGTIEDAVLEKVVDRSFDPPVTVEVRIVSVISDCLQHAGQAAYARGVLDTTWGDADG